MADLPEMTELAYAQGFVEFEDLHEDVAGVAIRMSQDNFEDSKWQEHSTGAIQVGMPFFPFHFVQPNDGPNAQIEISRELWNRLPFKPGMFGLDVENIAYTIYEADGVTIREKVNILPPSKERFTLWLMQLIDGIMRVTGLDAAHIVIYTRADYWNAWVLRSGTKFRLDGIDYTTPIWNKFKLWIASWLNYVKDIRLPLDWTEWFIWQYEGGTGRLPHISGPVDRDKFNGTEATLISFLKKAVATVTEPATEPVAPPYQAKTTPAWLTVLTSPNLSSAPVAWIPAGTLVIVSAEQSGFGNIGKGWVSLAYLGDKEALNPTPPPPLTWEQSIDAWARGLGYTGPKPQ